MSSNKPAQDHETTCEFQVAPRGISAKGLKDIKGACGRAAPHVRERPDGTAIHLCAVHVKTWDGRRAYRKPKPVKAHEVKKARITNPSTGRDTLVAKVTVQQGFLFDLPPVQPPVSDRVRLKPGQSNVYEVWLAGDGAPIDMGRDYMAKYYAHLLGYADQCQDDGQWHGGVGGNTWS